MRTRALLVSFVALGSVPAQSGWILRTPAVSPPVRTGHLLSYDVARNRTVLFGGGSNASSNWQTSNDTWEWDGTNWTQRVPVITPSPRCCGSYAYDLVRNRVVLFGGVDNFSRLLDETWEYDGMNWANVAVALGAPPPRQSAGMAFDVVQSRMVLFGGTDISGSSSFGDTWEWNGGAWTRLAPVHAPVARAGFGMTTDFGNARILLHGGATQLGVPVFRDTWSWNGADWTQIATAVQPPAVANFGFTYDWNRHVPVLFGGWPVSAGTWLFAGTTWVRDPSPVSPPAHAFACQIAYEVLAGRTVLFAGDGTTWEYGTPPLATWLPYGTGCQGTLVVPLLRSVGFARPVLGTTFVLELYAMTFNPLAAISLGFSATNWSGGALPASLAPFGMPGCTLWADPQFVFMTPIVGVRATISWPLPNAAALIGTRFYNQGFVLDPGVNALGAVVSNAGTGILGIL